MSKQNEQRNGVQADVIARCFSFICVMYFRWPKQTDGPVCLWFAMEICVSGYTDLNFVSHAYIQWKGREKNAHTH